MNKCLACYQPLSKGFYHSACAKKMFGDSHITEIDFDVSHLTTIMKSYVADRLTIPGVQKKLSVKLSDIDKYEKNNRLTIVGFLHGTHILKPPAEEYPFMPEVENLSMNIAKILGIHVADHCLVPLKSGGLGYLCKRFDRRGDKKIAVEDFCQLGRKFTHEKYRSSSEQLAKIIRQYSSNSGDDLLKLFEVLLHSFLIGNADMHMKNFSLITDDANFIHMSPAYDLLSTRLLIPRHQDREELALPMNGKKHNVRKKDWFEYAANIGITKKVVERVIARFVDKQEVVNQLIDDSFLPDDLKVQMIDLVLERVGRLS